MSFKIKEVDVHDEDVLADIKRLHQVCFNYDFKEDAELVKNGHWWFVYVDNEPIAFAGVTPSQRWKYVGYMVRAAVLEKYRGKGLQRKLIKLREKRARKLGWWYLITDTIQNPYSANNLISCGFRPFEPEIPWGHPETTYWRKKLFKEAKVPPLLVKDKW